MQIYEQYAAYRKPSWAPSGRQFAPVWRVLYILITISFGYVGYLWFTRAISLGTALPFALNLIFDCLFVAIQFKWRNFVFATLDIILVWVTLAWAMLVIWPVAAWVTYINLPYLAWISFATALQLAVTAMNRKP